MKKRDRFAAALKASAEKQIDLQGSKHDQALWCAEDLIGVLGHETRNMIPDDVALADDLIGKIIEAEEDDAMMAVLFAKSAVLLLASRLHKHNTKKASLKSAADAAKRRTIRRQTIKEIVAEERKTKGRNANDQIKAYPEIAASLVAKLLDRLDKNPNYPRTKKNVSGKNKDLFSLSARTIQNDIAALRKLGEL
ncbi:MAG: hypothetical protein AB1508_12630 [Pseudomonadota bacterium]